MTNDTRNIFLGIAIIIPFVIIFVVGLFLFSKEPKEKVSTPIQYIENKKDSIKLKITAIDSLKHEKVIEVQGLNNDSTLQLFYKLIRE